ncbi:hypothetical protein TWF730_004816 [Orbilia blumenaviensis]|uniref:Co-chaperone HscB C-terminal oligomerisation domain-containing protein n=1 Tax=Orbilia blumenaviensis TaxID=1796055 RepID=A0AAV9TWW2_9PEZI
MTARAHQLLTLTATKGRIPFLLLPRAAAAAAFLPPTNRHYSTSSQSSPETPPPGKKNKPTYYTLFPLTLPLGPPPSGPFTIPLRPLRSEFLKLQQSTHPDLFPPSQRKLYETASAQLNKAYTTLSSPLLRAEYLLSIKGHLPPSDDEGGKVADAELLLEVLDANELLETAVDEKELEPLKRRNEERIEGCVGRLEELFKDDAKLEEVRAEVVRLRYWVNLAEALRHWEPGKGVSLQH